MDQNPFRKSGSHVPGSSGANPPSPTGDNFRSMPSDNEEGAFKAPSFDSPAKEKKKGIANRFNQAEQAANEARWKDRVQPGGGSLDLNETPVGGAWGAFMAADLLAEPGAAMGGPLAPAM